MKFAYDVELNVTVYAEDVFDKLGAAEQTDFIDERVDIASDEVLVSELRGRGYKVEEI
jgi:hypothetical protein